MPWGDLRRFYEQLVGMPAPKLVRATIRKLHGDLMLGYVHVVTWETAGVMKIGKTHDDPRTRENHLVDRFRFYDAATVESGGPTGEAKLEAVVVTENESTAWQLEQTIHAMLSSYVRHIDVRMDSTPKRSKKQYYKFHEWYRLTLKETVLRVLHEAVQMSAAEMRTLREQAFRTWQQVAPRLYHAADPQAADRRVPQVEPERALPTCLEDWGSAGPWAFFTALTDSEWKSQGFDLARRTHLEKPGQAIKIIRNRPGIIFSAKNTKRTYSSWSYPIHFVWTKDVSKGLLARLPPHVLRSDEAQPKKTSEAPKAKAKAKRAKPSSPKAKPASKRARSSA
ncbi:unnamed protein product [Symbiodinium natans]|uniref:Uncharacterized protein n=1 Tax=Symbiodinium natans TaxID=878477 RepID=A0A812VFU9_9DINO|nr:unnamed protein product [Symbiodinium natans]